MLSRIVAKLRSESLPIDAFKKFLYDPLAIHRIRRAQSLIAEQQSDEARYQDPDLLVSPSLMSDARLLVPDEYGSEQVGLMEGGGGLTGAATDIARLVAILISQKDNPALKRATIAGMLAAGAQMTAAGWPRAGYGFDAVDTLNNGQFHAQKGGSLDSSRNVLQFNGEWGFAMQWGSVPSAAPHWYPDYPAVMDIARGVSWSSEDLFPHFGMPSL